MKISFLRLGALTISLLSAGVISVKLIELHVHIDVSPVAKAAPSNPAGQNQVIGSAADASARISFRRGNVGETISGVIGHSKSYILRAKSGQSLSATVTSANGCVAFDTGSTANNFTTAAGDNRVTVINNCTSQSPFSVSVEIR